MSFQRCSRGSAHANDTSHTDVAVRRRQFLRTSLVKVLTRCLSTVCLTVCVALGSGVPGYARERGTAAVVQIDTGRIAGAIDSGVAS